MRGWAGIAFLLLTATLFIAGCGAGEGASIEVQPVAAVNPVMSQHVLVATLKDSKGEPLGGRRVEWIIPAGSEGALIEVDGSKVTSQYAITHTAGCPRVLTRGTEDPSDDIHLLAGQTWAVITSPVEGTTNVIAYAPDIENWKRHKVFAVGHWYNVKWLFPPAAVGSVGAEQRLVTRVRRHSDGAPVSGYPVTYSIVSGPEATLNGKGKTATVRTDERGEASCTLGQTKPLEGVNEIAIDIMRPSDARNDAAGQTLVTGSTRVHWVGAKIAIVKNAPPRARVRQEFAYSIVVSNPSRVAVRDAIVADTLAEGIQYISSDPKASVSGQNLSWNIAAIDAGANRTFTVRVRAARAGSFKNCGQVTAAQGLSAESCTTTEVSEAKVNVNRRSETTAGGAIASTITIRNSGQSELSGVRVDETLPEGLTMEGGNRKAAVDIGALGPDESRDVTYHLRAARGATYTSQAVVTANEGVRATAPITINAKTAPVARKSDTTMR